MENVLKVVISPSINEKASKVSFKSRCAIQDLADKVNIFIEVTPLKYHSVV
jgi:hypothetical protein